MSKVSAFIISEAIVPAHGSHIVGAQQGHVDRCPKEFPEAALPPPQSSPLLSLTGLLQQPPVSWLLSCTGPHPNSFSTLSQRGLIRTQLTSCPSPAQNLPWALALLRIRAEVPAMVHKAGCLPPGLPASPPLPASWLWP